MTNTVKKLISAASAVYLVTIIVYLNSLSKDLVWDDASFIAGNPFISDCSNLKTALNPVYLAKILPVRMSARPVVNATLLLDVCSGAGPIGMKWTNILLHASNAVLVFATAYVLAGSIAPALLAGLLFGVHPAAAEAAAIITFRSQLLCVFFYLSALLTGIVYMRHRHPGFLAASAAAFLASALSNEAGTTFPLVFALMQLTAQKTGAWNDRKPLLIYLLVCAVLVTAYFWFRLPRGGYEIAGIRSFGPAGVDLLYPNALMPEGSSPLKPEFITLTPWSEIYTDLRLRIYTMVNIAGEYLGDLLLPVNLNSDYNPPVIRTFYGAVPGLAAVSLAILCGAALLRARPLAAFGIFFILTALLPVMNIIPIYNIKADRYLYLPLAGYSLIAAAVVSRNSGKYAVRGIVLYICVLGALTFARNPVFRSELSLFHSATHGRTRAAPRAETNMAAVYFTRGEAEKARTHMLNALAPRNNRQLRLRWAAMELFMGSKQKSGELLRTVLDEDPENPAALYFSGLAAWQDGSVRTAEAFFSRALAQRTGFKEARTALAVIRAGRDPSGLPAFRNAVKEDPCAAAAAFDVYRRLEIKAAGVNAARKAAGPEISAGCRYFRTW